MTRPKFRSRLDKFRKQKIQITLQFTNKAHVRKDVIRQFHDLRLYPVQRFRVKQPSIRILNIVGSHFSNIIVECCIHGVQSLLIHTAIQDQYLFYQARHKHDFVV